MQNITFNHALVYGFLVVVFLVGLWAGRGIKSIRDYALAGKVYGTGILTITLLATQLSGRVLFIVPHQLYTDGLIRFLVSVLGVVLSALFIGRFIVPKVSKFTKSLTMGEIMGEMYGKNTRMATGAIGFFFSICYTAVQVLVLGKIFSQFINVSTTQGVLIGGAIVIAYSTFGGIKSVTITDVVQFIMFIIAIPLIAYLVTHKAGGPNAILSQIPVEKLKVFGHKDFYKSLSMLLICFLPVVLSPPFVQRILMAKDSRQASNMYYISALFIPAFVILLVLISFGTMLLYPNTNPANIMQQAIQGVLPLKARGFAIAGLLAVVMSSADSYLNSAGLLVTNDICKPLCKKYHIHFNELKWVRGVTFLIGISTLIVAMFFKDITKLLVFGTSFLAIFITMPFILGVMGLKFNSKQFFTAMAAALIAFLTSRLFLDQKYIYLSMPIGMAVNKLTLLLVHWRKNNGFVIISDREKKSEKIYTLSAVFGNLIKCLPTPKKIWDHIHVKAGEYGKDSVLFSLFLSINYMAPYFMWNDKLYKHYWIVFWLRLIGGALCVGLMLKPKWPEKIKNFFPPYWYFTLLYCIPFSSMVMFYLGGGDMMWVLNTTLFIMILVTLVGWRTLFSMSAVGSILAVVFVRCGLGIHTVPKMMDKYGLLYTCLFSAIAGGILMRKKIVDTEKDKKPKK